MTEPCGYPVYQCLKRTAAAEKLETETEREREKEKRVAVEGKAVLSRRHRRETSSVVMETP
jgi:hypothetical protein